MLYEKIVDEWGTSYVPTTAGNILLGVIIVLLLVCAVMFARVFIKKSSSNAKISRRTATKQLVFCAMSIALGTVLSNIKVFEFPFGGSLTLMSMLVICLPGYFFGLGAGILTGAAHGVLQILIDPYILYPAQMVVDYLLAFGALGLSGIFANSKNGLLKGYIVGIVGRHIFTTLSGWIFFAEYAWEGWAPLPYSIVYNGCYIYGEAVITIIIIMLPPVKSAIARVKRMALE